MAWPFALIQASANQAGFNVTDCGSEQWGGLLGTPGAYDAVFFGWQSTSLGVTNSLPTFQTGGINNLNFYSNERVDEIVEQLNVEFDPATQIELQQELDKILWDDFYGVTIFQFPGVTAYSDRVTNIDPKTRKLGLSIKAREIAEEKEAVEQYGSSDSGASLGDILGAALKGNN